MEEVCAFIPPGHALYLRQKQTAEQPVQFMPHANYALYEYNTTVGESINLTRNYCLLCYIRCLIHIYLTISYNNTARCFKLRFSGLFL